jgi:hypothetical protein
MRMDGRSSDIEVAGVRVGGVDSHRFEAISRFSGTLAHPDVRREIVRLVESRWPVHASGEMSLLVLKAHKNRCTFEVSLATEDGPRSVIGKVHDVDRSDVFVAMQSIVHAGFGPEAEFAIPTPLAYLPEFHVLLEEKVSGTQAMRVFLEGDGDGGLAAAQRCGRWLARYHHEAPLLGKRERPEEFMQHVRGWAHRILSFGGDPAEKADSLFRMLEASVPGADTYEPRAGHGSYMPEHVMLSDRRVVTLDFDDHLVADPAHDVAWYLVSLERLGLKHGGTLRDHDGAVEAFLHAYGAAAPRNALAHVGFYKAAECMHRAHRDLFKPRVPIPAWSESMLDEGIRALHGDA